MILPHRANPRGCDFRERQAFTFLVANQQFKRDSQLDRPTFVGTETCAQCHQSKADLWRRSQHRLAMAHATDQSVLADFNDTSFDYDGVHSRFYRRDNKYFVETDGPDGKLSEFEIRYTFGVDPLQQYLIKFPDGRIQALSIAWDSRPKEQGGQRWFHLYPNENVGHDDRAALEQAKPELEFHVRGVPFDRRAKELRCIKRSVCDGLGRDQRGLRGLSRPGLKSRSLGAQS